MPPRSVSRTVRDFILYYYAKLVIAPSAGQPQNYRFIIDRYKRLKRGEITMSEYDREIQKMAGDAGLCAFCGARGRTVPTVVVPKRLGGPVGLHNLVHACRPCADSKDEKDLVAWWCDELGRDKDELPRVPAGLFLKLAYEKRAVEFGLAEPCRDIGEIWSGGTDRSAERRRAAR